MLFDDIGDIYDTNSISALHTDQIVLTTSWCIRCSQAVVLIANFTMACGSHAIPKTMKVTRHVS
jgi:hypothetical protein